MKKFILKVGLFSIPVFILILLYFVTDPFKVLYHYDTYFDEKENGTVFLNTDYVTTSNFENRYNEEKYNSFIFGNSRAWFYRIDDWQKFIGNEPAYHFDAAGENLYALHKKIRYLNRKGVDIRNALIVLDHSILKDVVPKSDHLGIISPQLVQYSNWFKFHTSSLSGFFNLQFIYAFIDFKISGEMKPYMQRKNLIESRPFQYDPVANELSFYYYDSLIKRNAYFTDERVEIFYSHDRSKKESPATIFEEQRAMLEDIAAVFKKHDTNYQIIISPLYNQESLAKEDADYLKSLFGASRVHDFSGDNEITRDYSNYYEVSHYRPPIARKLMKQVYQNEFRAKIR